MIHTHFDTLEAWARAAAQRLAAILQDDIDRRGKTSLAVPGGRTAQGVLPLLADLNLDWTRIAVTLVDERWVPPIHDDSNEALARTLLGEGVTIEGLYTGAPSPEAGLAEATERIEALLPLGCVLLGMGEDGHIASLFPGESVHETTLQTAARPDHPRISMTPKTLLGAQGIVLAVGGAEKCAVIERARQAGPETELPIRHILNQEQTPVFVLTA